MSLEATNLALLDELSQRVFARRVLVYVGASTVHTFDRACHVRIRALGAGGSGAKGQYATGGNAGTVGMAVAQFAKGEQLTITIPAGGVPPSGSGNQPGNAGGTLTITGPGVNISIPGGSGGVSGTSRNQNAATPAPTGLESYILSSRPMATTTATQPVGGAAAALLHGHPSYAPNGTSPSSGAGVGGPGSATSNEPGSAGPGGTNLHGQRARVLATPDADHSRLLVNVSGGLPENTSSNYASLPGCGGLGQSTGPQRHGGFGAGGGGSYSGHGGNGGTGGGGGSSVQYTPGAGGAGAVMLEIFELEI